MSTNLIGGQIVCDFEIQSLAGKGISTVAIINDDGACWDDRNIGTFPGSTRSVPRCVWPTRLAEAAVDAAKPSHR